MSDVLREMRASAKHVAAGGYAPHDGMITRWADHLERVETERDHMRWHAVEDLLPVNGERVLARYVGVYEARLVTFWDGGGSHHFGGPGEADGRGSQPATHWAPIPALSPTTDDQEQ